MSRYTIVLTDGTVSAGLAVGTPDEVYSYLTDGLTGVKRVEVHDAGDEWWPTAEECPING